MKIFLAILILSALTIISIYLLKAFDKISGRGPRQVADGLELHKKNQGR
jgi:hypothetical protein